MEKFILFFRGGSADRRSERWQAWVSALRESGTLVEAASLMKDGKVVKDEGETVQDFTFNVDAHARGFAIIQAENLDEAVVLSKGCPVFEEGGNVTVRPMEEGY